MTLKQTKLVKTLTVTITRTSNITSTKSFIGLLQCLRHNTDGCRKLYDLDLEYKGQDGTQREFKSSYGVYKHGAVASDSKICSDIGREIMQTHEGNAVDAAVATVLASTVIYPHSTGIGAGFFATIYHKKHGWYAVDARETAPMGIQPEMFSKREDEGKTLQGGLSVCAPGLIKGLLEMHTRFGSLPWKTLVEPALNLLKHGHPISNQTYLALVRNVARHHDIRLIDGFQMYLDTKGHVRPPGSMVRHPVLAKTMQTIADDPMSFYNGRLAQDIVEDIQDVGGILQLQDLEGYKVRIQDTLQTELPGGLTVHSGPPPAGGALVNYILSIMAGYNLSPDSIATHHNRVLTHHRFLEASRFASARNTELGDEGFVDVKKLVGNMTSRSYGDLTRKQINDSMTLDLEKYGAKFYNGHESGTSHTSILDHEGNAVSITSSLNYYFGSLVLGKRTGITFNNGISCFSHLYQNMHHSLTPSEANLVHPGKRPQSAMAPTVVWDEVKGRVCLVIGAAGADLIPQGLARSIADVLYFRQSVPRSIDQPKIFQELVPPILMAEDEIDQCTKRDLEAKGHHFLRLEGFTVTQMIHVMEDGKVVAGCDHRKGGQPSGF